MTEPRRYWIQKDARGGRAGYELRARVRKWVEVRTNTPLHLFDRTRIWRADGYLVIETEPYSDLNHSQLEVSFSGFNSQDWSVRIEASQHCEARRLITLASPKYWVLPGARQLGLQRQKFGPDRTVKYFLP